MKRSDPTAAAFFYGLCRTAATLFSAPAGDVGWASAIVWRAGLCFRTCTTLAGGKRFGRLVPILAAGWLAACSVPFDPPARPVAAPPPPVVRTDEDRLYFYRPNDSLFPAVRPEVIINGHKVGVSVVGEAFYRDAQPGRYEIFLTSDDEDLLTVTLTQGQTQYVRTSIAMGWLGPRLAPTSVEPELGELEVQSLVLVEPRLDD